MEAWTKLLLIRRKSEENIEGIRRDKIRVHKKSASNNAAT